MGLREELQQDLAEAFDSDLADAVTEFKGKRVVKGDYDPIEGTSKDLITIYSGRGVFGSYDNQLIDNESILSTDKKLTVLQNEVTEAPQVNDLINGLLVISVTEDSAHVKWTVQLRNG